VNEGWTWLLNSPKWHYFRDGRSLCKRFILLSRGEFESGNETSSDNCAAYRKARAAELSTASGASVGARP
jgi:hypothetical protein